MAARDLSAFAASAGWANATWEPIAGDASARSYTRLVDGSRSAILMDAPPPEEDVRPFIHMAEWLRENGLAAPRVLAADEALGAVLLTDLGDRRLHEVVEEYLTEEEGWYGAALAVLLDVQTSPAANVPIYDRATLQREADLFLDWWAPAAGLELNKAGWHDAWQTVLATLEPPSVTTLRDYHSENLMILDRRTCAEFDVIWPIGLLDFQDALVGHPAYDLVSLLQDARRDVSPALEAAMLDRYRAATGAGDAFDAAYAILGAQRGAKVMGIFARLSRRDRKHRYLPMIPRVRAHLERDLAHPALAQVARWWAANVPPHATVAAP